MSAMHGGAVLDVERAEDDAGIDPRMRRLLERRSEPRGSRRGSLVLRALVAADLIGLTTAFVLAELISGFGSGAIEARDEFLLFIVSLPGWLVVAKLLELYDRDEERADHTTADDLVAVFHLATTGAWLFFAVAWLSGLAELDLPKLALFWILAIVCVTTGRAIARKACRRSNAYRQSTIIVGAGEIGQLVARKFRQHPEYGIELVGFVDAEPMQLRGDLGGIAVLGPPERLVELVRFHDVERVVIAFSNERHKELLEIVGTLKGLDIQIDIVPRLFEATGPNICVHSVEGLPLIGLPSAKLFPFSRPLKRALDVAIAAVTLLVTAPLFAYIAVRIKLDSEGPVFFRQPRLGKEMREFEALKFRTMTVGADAAVHRAYIAQTMDPRALPNGNGLYKLERPNEITGYGRKLRRTSLDELPNLINVLRGEMSLVGPRPCIRYETEFFEDQHFERFLVPAGITGLWQVTARAHSTFSEALALDVAYARNWSLGLDLLLLLKTPFAIMGRSSTT